MSESPIKNIGLAGQSMIQSQQRALKSEVDLYKEGRPGISGAIEKGLEGVTKIAGAIKDKKEKTDQEVADGLKEGQELATDVLDSGGSLGNNYFDAFNSNIKGLQTEMDEAAKNKDKDAQGKITARLNGLNTVTSQLKDLRTDIAKTFDSKSVEGKEMPNLIKNLSIDDQGLLKAMLDPNAEIKVEEKDGKFTPQVMFNGKWVSTKDIEDKLYDCKEDVVSINSIQKLRDGINNKALEDVAISTDDENFNSFSYDDTKMQVSKLLKSGNMMSLINDDVLGTGSSFKEDLLASPQISNITYSSLGIGVDKGQAGSNPYDTDGDGKMSPAELDKIPEEMRVKIADALTNKDNDFFKEDVTRGLMEDYITTNMEMNYNKKSKRGSAAESKLLYGNKSAGDILADNL